MNLPNKLTVCRICLVPVFVVVMLVWKTEDWASLVGCAVFGIASFTDFLDGKIARSHGLITDFGKFLDPLADKFLVIAALLCILYRTDAEPLRTVIFLSLMIVIFRELAVTSMRLVVSSSSQVVIAANMLGKIKTVSQIVSILTLLLEPFIIAPVIPVIGENRILSFATLAFMSVMTLWSGIHYLRAYWKYLDPQK